MNRLLAIITILLILVGWHTVQALANPAGRLYLLDDCTGRTEFFFQGEVGPRKFKYENNMYLIDARKSRIYANSVHTDNLNNYTIVTNLRLLETRTYYNQTVMGVSFNFNQDSATKTHSFYTLVIRADHRLILYQNVNDEITQLWQSVEIPNTDLSRGVLLTVAVKGRDFTFSVDGKLIGSYSDKNTAVQSSGGVGIYAGPFTLVGVTQFKVYVVPPIATTYKETFTDQPPPKTWFVGEAFGVKYLVEDGKYTIDARNSDKVGLSLLWPVGSDYDVLVDTKFNSGDDSTGYGLVFRATDDGQGGIGYYRLLITAQGAWALQIRRHGREDNIIDWQLTDYFKPNAVNKLEVRCRGMRFSLFLNDKELTTLEYESYPSGTVGLIVGPGASVSFDNFWLKTGSSSTPQEKEKINAAEKIQTVQPSTNPPRAESDDPNLPPQNLPPEGI